MPTPTIFPTGMAMSAAIERTLSAQRVMIAGPVACRGDGLRVLGEHSCGEVDGGDPEPFAVDGDADGDAGGGAEAHDGPVSARGRCAGVAGRAWASTNPRRCRSTTTLATVDRESPVTDISSGRVSGRVRSASITAHSLRCLSSTNADRGRRAGPSTDGMMTSASRIAKDGRLLHCIAPSLNGQRLVLSRRRPERVSTGTNEEELDEAILEGRSVAGGGGRGARAGGARGRADGGHDGADAGGRDA